MRKNVTVLGFSGSGKTTYILNLYNHYNKSMNSKDYLVQIENKEEKNYLDKLLRELKLKKSVASTHTDKDISFSLYNKPAEKKLAELTVKDVAGEMLFGKSEESAAYFKASDLIVFMVDSSRIFSKDMDIDVQDKKIIEILMQYGRAKRKPVLFLFSKYDRVLDKLPNLSFEEYSDKYLNNLIELLNKNNMKAYECMELSCFSEANEEISLNEQINLRKSFEWIVKNGVVNSRQNTLKKNRIMVILLTILIVFFASKTVQERKRFEEASLDYGVINDLYASYIEKNEFDEKNWEILYSQVKEYQNKFSKEGNKDNILTVEKQILEKLKELKLKMIRVERGSFIMGSNEDKGVFGDYSKPVHEVEITYDYWIDKYEVTNEEYVSYLNDVGVKSDGTYEGKERINMKADENFEIEYDNDRFYITEDSEKKPVHKVTWWGAVSYCNWLSQKEGLTPSYDNNGELQNREENPTEHLSEVQGYRLPSEAEWEYAAKGGNKSKSYLYSGSNVLNEVGWYAPNIESDGVVFFNVGGKKPNELGIYDMSGNVEEWCQDCMDLEFYAKSPPKDPVMLFGMHEKECFTRILRGGASYSDESSCRVTNRFAWGVDESYIGSGFRVVRTVEQ